MTGRVGRHSEAGANPYTWVPADKDTATTGQVRHDVQQASRDLRRGGKHDRLRSQDGKTALIVPVRPSDHRSHANFRSQVRPTRAESRGQGMNAAS
jgi:hypothetical protein